jgi:nucleoside-diphosphate-sugar epimerase
MAKIFLTGITGFLGSNVAGYLIDNGHDVVAIYRPISNRDLCSDYIDKVEWILQNENSDNWIQKVIDTSPQVVIHAAWLGVGHQERDCWETQFLNIKFLETILYIAHKSNATKFLGLGSQAEYGLYNGCINESEALNPYEAYGCIKIICSEMVKQYCVYNKISWYWLRLFSFFGKGESEKWLIPSLVKKILYSDEMDLTSGEQKYTFLYVNDLARAINKIIVSNGNSGIYNISGGKLVMLRSVVEDIRNKINSSFKLNFGKLSYRTNQSMHMQGDSSKFIKEFGEFELSNFESSLSDTIEYLKLKFNNQINESI